MKTLIKVLSLTALLAGGSVSFFSGCAATATRESTGEYVDDSTITAKVKASFVNDSMVKAREISVETFKGTVQLSGFVASEAEKTRAEQLAAGVAGVREVRNNITLK